jgi:hypothetical protein
MTAREFALRVRSISAEMQINRKADCLRIMTDLKGLVFFRVQSKGLDSRNQKFKPYSARRKKEREAKGRQVEYVDFTDEGKLASDTRARVINETETTVTIEISAPSEGYKLSNIFAVRGDRVIDPSLAEIDLAFIANQARANKYRP